MQVKAKEITLLPISKLSTYPKNANEHTEEQIDRLIQLVEFYGNRDPIIVDHDVQPDGTHWVIAGNGRLLAARKAGWETLPAIIQKFKSDDEKYGFMVSHNAINASQWGGGLDLSLINLELQNLGPDFDLENLGIKDFKLDLVEHDIAELENQSTGEAGLYQKIFFLMTNEQKDILDDALNKMKQEGLVIEEVNENTDANALTEILKIYLNG